MHPFQLPHIDGYDPNRFIYHFTTIEIATNHILPNRNLKFSQLGKVNDPKESRSEDWQVVFREHEGDPGGREQIREFFRWNVKVACFSRDDCDLAQLYVLDRTVRGYCKPRMWATYGDNHKGVCLVFDRHLLQQTFEQQGFSRDTFLHGAVKYCSPARNPDFFRRIMDGFSVDLRETTDTIPSVIAQKIEEYSDIHFFFKHCDWATEAEYRFVIAGGPPQEEYVSFGNALVGIAVGMDACPSSIRELVQGADKLRIPIIQTIVGLNHSNDKEINLYASHVIAPTDQG